MYEIILEAMIKSLQSASIFLQDPVHSHAMGEIFISDDQAQIAKNGHLFILVDIEESRSEYEQFIASLLEKASHTYRYSVLEDSTKLLEYTLSELNSWLPENLPDPKRILPHLNLVVGNCKDGIVNIAAIGQWQSYLIHPLKSIDILGAPEKVINPAKIFQNVITGKLNPGQVILVSNQSLFDYLAMEKIRKIVTTIPARSAAEQLKNMVVGAPPKTSFLSVILKMTSGDEAMAMNNHEPSREARITQLTNSLPSGVNYHSRQSLDELINTQQRTEKIMTVPSSLDTIGNGLRNLGDKLTSSPAWPKLRAVFKLIGQGILKGLKIVGELLNFGLRRGRRLIVNIFLPGVSRPEIRHRLSISSLSSQRKTTLGIIGALIIIFVLIVVLNPASPTGISEETLVTRQSEFQALEESIEAALIYGDRTRAQSLLTDISIVIAQLPENDPKYQSAIADLRLRYAHLTERIWNIMNIDEPVVLADLTNPEIGPAVGSDFDVMTATGDTVYVLGHDKGILTYNFAEKSFSTAIYAETQQGWAEAMIGAANEVLAINNANNFYRISADGLIPINITLSAGLQSIAAADSFINRIYLLDSAGDQLYRHGISGNRYLAPDLWIRDNVDLAGATSLAIDGNIYILKENDVLKFTNGRQVDFPALNIYPPLNKPTIFYTAVGVTNLYLLDPNNQRVIIFNKEGELIRQIRSAKFGNLQDMVIQEEAKRMFLLSEDKLFVVPL
ncbi:MAG: hypothetical protein NUV82_01515 [Candidatus Komeilibacteria bacterium]|nr:hypothetical protein [Candidatus Komeilibacteria bacterium]